MGAVLEGNLQVMRFARWAPCGTILAFCRCSLQQNPLTLRHLLYFSFANRHFSRSLGPLPIFSLLRQCTVTNRAHARFALSPSPAQCHWLIDSINNCHFCVHSFFIRYSMFSFSALFLKLNYAWPGFCLNFPLLTSDGKLILLFNWTEAPVCGHFHNKSFLLKSDRRFSSL